MIQSLLIKNLQVIRKMYLEFDPLASTLWGATDAGKSTILRALRWLCLNRKPRKGSFVRHGHLDVSVDALIDGMQLIREQSDTVNQYILNGKEFKALRDKVPEEVSNFLKVDDVNFQNQNDSYFWFSLTPGEVSRELNQIVHLESIDAAMDAAASNLRKARSEAEVGTVRLENAKKTLSELKWVGHAHEEYTHIENLASKLEKRRNKRRQLVSLLESARQHTQARRNALKAKTGAEKVASLGGRWYTAHAKAAALGDLIAKARQAQKVLKAGVPSIDALGDIVIKAADNFFKLDHLKKAIRKYQQAEVDLCRKKQALVAGLKELEMMTKGKLCPVCQHPL